MHATLDIDQARFNMIEQQIRPWDVLDQDVLDLLEVVRREEFVPPAHRLHAFTDIEIPLDSIAPSARGAAMWSPKMEARVLQEVQPRRHDRALEIGAGTGYFAALLAHCCHAVTTVEIVPELKALAERNLKAAHISNARVQLGDGATGYGGEKYDIIVLSGSTPVVAEHLFRQLNPGGRLFAVTGDAPAMIARVYTSGLNGGEDNTVQELFETVLTPLVNAPQPKRFTF
jgi:protein-L-isoaspartate(D-aspartate) O-methyltransferase